MTISTLPSNKINITETIYYIIHHYYTLEIYQNLHTYNNNQNDDMWKIAMSNVEPTISSRSKKSLIYLIEYGGKTFENGNGIIFLSDVNIPSLLKQMIAAYIILLSNQVSS